MLRQNFKESWKDPKGLDGFCHSSYMWVTVDSG